MLRFSGLVLAAALLIACPGVERPVEDPIAEVEAVALGSVSMVGIDAPIAVEVTNPNDTAVTLAAVDWELALARAGAIRGRARLSERIAPRTSTTVVVPARIDAHAAASIAPHVRSGPTRYELRAVLHFQSDRADRAVVVDHVGHASRSGR